MHRNVALRPRVTAQTVEDDVCGVHVEELEIIVTDGESEKYKY